MPGNAVVHVQEMTSQNELECMRFRFSETNFSQNAKIWDIRVSLGFHINLTVTDLQVTYHPRSHSNLVKGGHYTGQGLAIGNHTAVCQRTTHQSYLLPTSEVRVILNYTWIPDRPVLEFMYEAIALESIESYLTLFDLNLFNLYYFESFQKTKRRLILHIKTWVRFTVSLVNVTLVCKNNFSKGKELYFIDGPIFLVGSYLQSYALIASLECENIASNTANATLKGTNGRYLYMDQVKASIGDLTAVLLGPDKDMSKVNFKFNLHPPNNPYSHFILTDYTNTKPDITPESVIANLDLPIARRHFHIVYWLARRSSKFLSTPRLVFHIRKFDMVSFQDGCNTGGIFIGEVYHTIASYCSRAGINFLNATSQTRGILFGASPLVIILKGYSWFANIQLNISVSYDDCLGVTNICDKIRDNSPLFPKPCEGYDNIPCRYVVPTPCIEIVRLP